MRHLLDWLRPGRAPGQHQYEEFAEEIIPLADLRSRTPRLHAASAHLLSSVGIARSSPISRAALLLYGEVAIGCSGRTRGQTACDDEDAGNAERTRILHWLLKRRSIDKTWSYHYRPQMD
jgi:hypothetical protein